MQSRNAYILGSFVIPEGATTGARIEFDAENGFIRVYGTGGDLTNTIGFDPSSTLYGFVAYGIGTRLRAQYQSDGVWLLPDPAYPISENVFNAGHIRWKNPGINDALPGYTEWTAPQVEAADNSVGIQILNRSRDETTLPQLRFGSSEDTDPATFQFAGYVYAAKGELGAPDVVSWVREDWSNLGFAAGWGNSGAPYANAQYKLTADGVVHLRGMIAGPAVAGGTLICGFPNAAYSAPTRMVFPVATLVPAVHGGISIDASGSILVYGGVTSVSLDGISYSII